MKKKIIAIIPVRMESSRFYGKPLKKIHGLTMVNRIYKILTKCNILDEIFVATPNKEIFNHVLSFGGNPVMTNKKHKRASDRCTEALNIIEKKKRKKYDIVVMVQGDEPMIDQYMIKKAVMPLLKDKNIKITNLCSAIQNKEDFLSKNTVKVIFNKFFDAIYFSREPIPNQKKTFKGFKQVCIIPFERNFLYQYGKLKPTFAEKEESIDMNRILEHGKKIKMVKVNKITYPVDTLSDLKKVIRNTYKI